MAAAALPLALSLAGTVFQVIGQVKQTEATERAEEARKREMQLSQMRTRREQIRQAQVARASAVSSAYNQGAGSTTALQGGIAQVGNQAGRNIQASYQSTALGNKVFNANKDFASAGLYGAFGQGLSSLGGAIGNNMGTLTRLGS